MTWDKAAWAIDGPRTKAALARLAEYAATGSTEGLIARGDLKVSATVPASGKVKVDPGGALVRNRSTGAGKQTYVVNNDSAAAELVTIGSTGAGNGRSDLVVVRIKDPEFAPWANPAAGTESTYQYVESFVVAGVPGNTKKIEDLALNYSAYALARIDLPANTSVITAGMIVDLRKLARPRSETVISHLPSSDNDLLNPAVGVWEMFPNGNFVDVDVPDWASVAKVTGFVEGVRLVTSGQGKLRIGFLDGGAAQATNIDDAPTAAGARRSYNLGGEINIPDNYRGTNRRIRIEGTIDTNASSGFLKTDIRSSGQIQVRFEERAL